MTSPNPNWMRSDHGAYIEQTQMQPGYTPPSMSMHPDATTTPEPQPTYWPPQPTAAPTPTPTPKRPRRMMWLIAAAVALVIVIAVTVAITLATQKGGTGTEKTPAPAVAVLTEPAAQRACRTAFNGEWQQRVENVGGGSDSGIVISLQGIDMQETWKTADGYSVNGLVRYTMTTGIVDPVNDTIGLTCAATGTDDNVFTTISNR